MPRQPGGGCACLPEGLSRGETGHAQPGLCSQQFWASPCQRPSSGLSVRLTTQGQRLASPMAVRVPTLETEAAAPAPWVPGLLGSAHTLLPDLCEVTCLTQGPGSCLSWITADGRFNWWREWSARAGTRLGQRLWKTEPWGGLSRVGESWVIKSKRWCPWSAWKRRRVLRASKAPCALQKAPSALGLLGRERGHMHNSLAAGTLIFHT